MDRPPPSIGLKLSLWMVRRMYQVEVYLRVRRAVMVDGISIREASRVFRLHRDTVRKMTNYSSLRATGGRIRPGAPSWSPSPASSTGYWSRT